MLRTGRFGVAALRFGLSFLAVHASFGQEVHPASRPGEALTIWAASNVAPSCGDAIPRAALQQDVETQLRVAGIAVSRVHTAALTVDVDCVPVIARARTTGQAVHQCLDLSQRVSLPSPARGVTLATTWRKCQSYTCRNGQCEAKVRSGLRSLVDAFLTDIGQSNSASELPAQPIAAKLPAIGSLTVNAPVPKLTLTPVATFYLMYIMTCLAVLVRWEYCRPRVH